MSRSRLFGQMRRGKTTPSGMYLLLLRSKAAKSAPLQGLVNASSIVVLIVRSRRDRDSDGPALLNHIKTWLTSHTELYLGLGGLLLKTPFRMRVINGCLPTSSPSIFS